MAIRLKMIKSWATLDYDLMSKEFCAERRYKLGLREEYSSEEAAFAHRMHTEDYDKLVGSMEYHNGAIHMNLDHINTGELREDVYITSMFMRVQLTSYMTTEPNPYTRAIQGGW